MLTAKRRDNSTELRGLRCPACGAAQPRSRWTKPLADGKCERHRECRECGAAILCEERVKGLLRKRTE